MAEIHEHVWRLEGDTDDLEKALRDTDRAMDRLTSSSASAEKTVAKLTHSTKGTADASTKAKGAFDASRKALAAFGGSAGTAAQMGGDFIESLVTMGGALGPVAMGASAAAIGVGLLTAGTLAAGKAAIDFARSAVDAHERLVDLGLAGEDSGAAMETLGESLQALDASIDTVTVAFAAASPELQSFVDRIIGFLDVLASGAETVIGFGRSMNDMARTFMEAVADDRSAVGGLVDSIFGWGDSLEEAGKEQRLAISAAIEGKKATEALEQKIRDEEKAQKAVAAARRDSTSAAKEAKKEVDDWVKAMDGLVSVIDDADADRLTGVQQINLAYQARIDKINELGGDEELQAEARRKAEERLTRDLFAYWAEQDRAYFESLHARTAAAVESVDEIDARNKQATDDFLADQQEASEAQISAVQAVADSVGSLIIDAAEMQAEALMNERDRLVEVATLEGKEHKERRARAKERLEWVDSELDKAEKAMRRGFVLQQAAAVSQIWIDAAKSAMALIPFFSFAGPAAPGLALGVAVAAGSAQSAQVMKQKPPTLRHSGGLLFGPDEFPMGDNVVARRGEAGMVFNQRAVEQGAIDVANALNRGDDVVRPITLQLTEAGRVVGRATALRAARPGTEEYRAAGAAMLASVNPYGGR